MLIDEIRLAEQERILGVRSKEMCEDSRYATDRRTLLNIMAQVANANKQADAAVAYVTGHLQRHGVTVILLKGQGLARMYPEPELRQPGDIDLYVEPDMYDKAAECLAAIADGDSSDETDKHIAFSIKGVEVELHRYAVRLYGKHRHHLFLEYTREQLVPERCDMVLIGDAEVLVPSLQFNALYLFLHFWDHFEMGEGTLRQLTDIDIVMANRDRIDMTELHTWLARLGYEKQWLMCNEPAFRSMVSRKLPVPKDMPRGFRRKICHMLHYNRQFLRVAPYCNSALFMRYVAFMAHKFRYILSA